MTDPEWRAQRNAQTAAWKRANAERHAEHQARRRARQRAAQVEEINSRALLDHLDEIGNYGCAYCGGPAEELEHVMPLVRGGAHSRDNVVWSCIECNRGIGGKHDGCPYRWLAERFPRLRPVLEPWFDYTPAKP
ncbi:HNH endonuclease [Streptomyces sp. R02]|uniref:HNH endonuclease n=1 Tax=Streptomyces sp. R02 TaxID=3238623 RepID=A0AB39LPS3_9ACTN